MEYQQFLTDHRLTTTITDNTFLIKNLFQRRI